MKYWQGTIFQIKLKISVILIIYPWFICEDIGVETFNRISSEEIVIKVSTDHIGPSDKLINTNLCFKKNPYESCIISQEIDYISFHKPLTFTAETPTVLKANCNIWYPLNKKTINTHGIHNWSIFSNNISYTTHSNTTTSNIKLNTYNDHTVNKMENSMKHKVAPINTNLGNFSSEEYMDSYNGIRCELKSSVHFDESTDIVTTYLGLENMTLDHTFNLEENFPFYANSHTLANFQTGGVMDILLDSGTSKSYMSKSFYLRNTYLHHIPKFISNTRSIQVGNGQFVSALFIIPIVHKIDRHLFEIYTLVSEIQDNIGHVIGVKNMFELEGKLSFRHSQFKFLNRSVPIFSVEDYNIPLKDKRQVKIKTSFHEELSGIAISNVFDGNTILTLKMQLSRNYSVVEITNNYNTTYFIDHRKSLGIVTIRSLGYYNINHQTLSNNLSSIFEFECLAKLCNQYNEGVNKMNSANKGTFYKIKGTSQS